jgi:ATP-dependent DNA helicase RecG
MDTIELTVVEAGRILALEEDHFHDLKSIEIRPAKLTKSISAFANADGGELFIGIDEQTSIPGSITRKWSGFTKIEDANGHIQAIEEILAAKGYYRTAFLKCATYHGYVLHVEILKSREVIYTSDSSVYVRKGAQSLPVTGFESQKRLEFNKGVRSFESERVHTNPNEITNSAVVIGFMLEVVPSSEPENWLKKQQLIIDEQPTVAGVVLFADEPQAILPKRCGIKVYRFKSEEEEGTRETMASDPFTIEGCLYDQIYNAVNATKEIIEAIRRMTPSGLEKINYPEETLHEIITNAAIHRDYSIPDDIHVRVFDNRVEVENPGTLPGHITVENILDERFARNGNIVRVINKFPNPPNKDIGEGLNTAFRAMQVLRLREPVIIQKENSVLVTIRHEKLGSPQELILEYLQDNPTISNSIARDICVIREDWRVRKIFNDMVSAGMIEKVPGSVTSNTEYRRV